MVRSFSSLDSSHISISVFASLSKSLSTILRSVERIVSKTNNYLKESLMKWIFISMRVMHRKNSDIVCHQNKCKRNDIFFGHYFLENSFFSVENMYWIYSDSLPNAFSYVKFNSSSPFKYWMPRRRSEEKLKRSEKKELSKEFEFFFQTIAVNKWILNQEYIYSSEEVSQEYSVVLPVRDCYSNTFSIFHIQHKIFT